MEHCVSLYANNLLLYVSDPSGHVIVSLLGQLNFHKSKCFPINNLALQIPRGIFAFSFISRQFQISRNMKDVLFHISQPIYNLLYLENKVTRINKYILQRGREVGGLGLPSLIHYYWASNIEKGIIFAPPAR